MLRPMQSLPHTGLVTLGSGAGRFPPAPPACYRASWQLPGPDFHRQATTSLRTRRNTMALRHGVTSRSAGRTRKPQYALLKTAWPEERAVALLLFDYLTEPPALFVRTFALSSGTRIELGPRC